MSWGMLTLAKADKVVESLKKWHSYVEEYLMKQKRL